MRYRFRERYAAAMGKRQHLRAEGAFSVPDEAGSKVAILVPYLEEVVYDQRDSRANFEKQTAELIAHYLRRERDPYHVMGATPGDFEQALTDASVSTVVVEGFGNFSAIAVPFSKDRSKDMRYGYLDWQHLAGMANHLKLGKFVMYSCCGFMRAFNPPLAAGIMNSHADIVAPTGQGIHATGMQDNEALMKPVTTEENLTYDAIKQLFRTPPPEDIPAMVPEAAYMAARGVYHHLIRRQNPQPEYEPPRSTPIPYPDLREYL